MKKLFRRHRNPEVQEDNQKPFFSRVSEKSVQPKKEKHGFLYNKLFIGKKDNKEEKEADNAAKFMINRASKEDPLKKKKVIQKKDPEEELPLQKKLNLKKNDPEEEEPLQGKLNLKKNVPEEEELVQGKINLKEDTPEEEEPIQGKLDMKKKEPEDEELVQGKKETKLEDEKIQRSLLIQRQEEDTTSKHNHINSPNVIYTKGEKKTEISNTKATEDIEKTKGKGIHLPQKIRAEMEAFFKADFSRVIIHTDLTASNLCRKLNARAFTNGYDIYFNTGQYNPECKSGKELLVHELTHVVQQLG